jgi:hypothetical protein
MAKGTTRRIFMTFPHRIVSFESRTALYDQVIPTLALHGSRAQYKSHIFSILRPIPPTLNEIHCALPQLIWRWLGRFLPCRWSRKIS